MYRYPMSVDKYRNYAAMPGFVSHCIIMKYFCLMTERCDFARYPSRCRSFFIVSTFFDGSSVRSI